MKIKKITEINEEMSPHEWYHLTLYDHFLKNENVFFRLLNLNKYLRINLDIFVSDLEPQLLYKIVKYNEFMEEYGSYEYFVIAKENEESYITLQIDIPKSQFGNLEDGLIKIGGLKFHPEINKYNL